ncbi:hypothetical protein THAOC_32782 [Thalassiosira oceanica]|uniref:Uncharacterized protein n=1 Tax=Thalassiosira oceanica TaxID=159749 RepID=K0R580_THAOC|nr:hypothetical protein THAOC_32782 [Thalassiosira oceanica]|eukprot:EJK48418.1 hypothetical protein THAOC_32782 [Thalassiosira oceanica]
MMPDHDYRHDQVAGFARHFLSKKVGSSLAALCVYASTSWISEELFATVKVQRTWIQTASYLAAAYKQTK